MELFRSGMDRMNLSAALRGQMLDGGSIANKVPNARLRDDKTEIVRRPSSREINSAPEQFRFQANSGDVTPATASGSRTQKCALDFRKSAAPQT